ncbi:hypothetical protein GOBAR_DD23485 [Gossypium barbadense]|nr:hypothetical protein GOBAR_DD23485 [Gossypium barbadense]
MLDDEEEVIHEVTGEESFIFQFCLVGRFLTDSVVHFPSLRNTMADLWHPIGGICITEAGEKRYLFQFFNVIDFDKVKAGTPWFFNNHLLILQEIPERVNPTIIDLRFTEFWMQVHGLPPGSMNESMAKQFGNFCGDYLEYNTSFPTLGSQTFLRIRVRLDVTAPLKRKKKDLSLRAASRRRNTMESRWLRTADETSYVADMGGHSNQSSLLYGEKRLGWSSRSATENQNIDHNLVQLGAECYSGSNRDRLGFDGGDVRMGNVGDVDGSMELFSNDEENPTTLLEGKKRQCIMESSRLPLETIGGSGHRDVSASSGYFR